MKVLHLIGGGDVGGAKIHVLSLVKELGKHIDVKIISLRHGMFADDAISLGIDVEIIKSRNIFKDIKDVIKIIKRDNFQILHSHGAKANMISVVSRLFTKIPKVTTVHSDYRLDYIQNILKKFSFGVINTLALRFIDYYIGVSNNFKNMLINRNFNTNRIFTVYNGLDFDITKNVYPRSEFAAKYKIDVKDGDIVIGILARLHPVKGITTFIKAAKEVLAQNPSVKFVIGGEGEERKTLERVINSLNLSKSVFLLGFIDNAYQFMSNLDVNVLTSISESFPYSILEGALFKKATISTNVGGISDLIEHETTGYLFEPGDHVTLSKYMLNLVNDRTLRLKLGGNLYDKASAQFSLKSMCQRQVEIYSLILEDIYKRSLNKKYDVIISGYYGFKNVGDDAMLMAIINNLRTYKNDMDIVVLSKTPLETARIYDVDSVYRFDILKIIKIMRNSKLFLNGGGSLIQDNTSTRSLFYYLCMILLAKIMRTKTMVYANGIGPLSKPTNRKFTSFVLNKVDVITLREKLSLKEIEDLRIKKPATMVTADPAFSIKSVSDEEINDIFTNEGIDSSASLVGFSIREWVNKGNCEEIIARVADYAIERYGLTPVFIPMHYPNDLIIIGNVVSKMKGKGYIIKNNYSAPQILGIISRMEFLIGMRLHALIFAASVNIPVIGLVYEQKVEGFMQYINQTSVCSVISLNLEKLILYVDNVMRHKNDIKQSLSESIGKLQSKALENAKIAVSLLEQ